MGRRALPIALFVALVLAAAAVALRAIADDAAAGPSRSPSDLLPLLFAAAGLCVAGLLRERAPAGAWLAIVSVGAIGAIVILGAVRAMLAVEEPEVWPALVLIGQGALLAAAGIAAAYAIRGGTNGRGRRQDAWRLIVLAGLAVVAASGGWAVAEVFAEPRVAAAPSSDFPFFRVSTRLAAGFIALTALAGIWHDLSAPFERARARSGSLRELPRAITEELLPNATAARRHGRDEERARIAADLHALVLPDLRRAAAAAQAAEAADAANTGGPGSVRDRTAAGAQLAGAPPVASDLRHALEGVERLMHQRQSIVLEEYGLVAALEWLAEQTQQRGGLVVDIELDGADVGNAAAVPPTIARAAFRVALLALDNVVRHAAASRALIRLDIEGGRGRLAVIDDGRGIEDATAPLAGRGLIDMRTAANEVHAAFAVEHGDRGTAIEMAWATPGPTAGIPAATSADITARGPGAHA